MEIDLCCWVLKTKVTGSIIFYFIVFLTINGISPQKEKNKDRLCNDELVRIFINKVETFHRYFPHMFKRKRLELKERKNCTREIHCEDIFTQCLRYWNNNNATTQRFTEKKNIKSTTKNLTMSILRDMFAICCYLSLFLLSTLPLPKGNFFLSLK